MIATLIIAGLVFSTVLFARNPIKETLANRHKRKLAKIQNNKKIKLLQGRVKYLEKELADKTLKSYANT